MRVCVEAPLAAHDRTMVWSRTYSGDAYLREPSSVGRRGSFVSETFARSFA